MGVYIKGMEMPKNCWECQMVDTEFSFCHAMESYPKDEGGHYVLNAEIPDWCPLVPVPPHGRLIDADALKETFCGNCFADEKPMECSEPCMDMKIILEAPTIIEAEEGE